MLVPVMLLAAIAFSPMLNGEFLAFDDRVYLGSSVINSPFSWANLTALLLTPLLALWHPLTSLTLHLEHLAFGENPIGYHAVSLLTHLANIGLVYVVIFLLSGSVRRSALVSAFFGLHPLRVESVAWIVEIKDLGSSFFALASLVCYIIGVRTGKRSGFFGALLGLGLSLLFKPMYVTLPLLMLILDVWPLGRWEKGPGPQAGGMEPATRRSLPYLVIEKVVIGIPAALIVPPVVMPGLFFTHFGISDAKIPLAIRVSNIPVGYVRYLYKMIDFRSLCCHYPLQQAWPWWQVAGSAGILVLITMLVWKFRKGAPVWMAGWIWFVVALVPVSGILQVSRYSLADRYSYLACLGPTAALVFSIPRSWVVKNHKSFMAAMGCIVITICTYTYMQCGYWHDSMIVYAHGLEVEPSDSFCHVGVGSQLERLGRNEEAELHFRQAIELDPLNLVARYNLAALLWRLGQKKEAWELSQDIVREFPSYGDGLVLAAKLYDDRGDDAKVIELMERARKLGPRNTAILAGLGDAYEKQGDLENAAACFGQALEIDPDMALVHFRLARILDRWHQADGAEFHYRRTLVLDSRNVDACIALGIELASNGRPLESLEQFDRALAISPENPTAWFDKSIPLLRLGRFEEAAQHCRRAISLRPDFEEAHYNLAMALLQLNQTEQAIVELRECLRLQPQDAAARRALDKVLGSDRKKID